MSAGADIGAELVCECHCVTEQDIIAAIKTKKIQSIDDFKRCLNAGDGCTSCHSRLNYYLKKYQK